ncbi:MAG: NAD(P)-binding domain-containing protein [Bacteroidales bacterium]|nr:NAD(P)-binding domain-containing protein [Bacteroidales bacterium]
MKKIGIIGSGTVAQSLAKGFLKNGYQVVMGTRTAEKLQEFKNTEANAVGIGGFDEAASFGEIVVLAVKGTAAKEALQLAGATNLAEKTILDATNPIADQAPESGVLHFFTTLDSSLMEQLQQAFPEAHFVKAFNSVGSAFMVDPSFESKPTMFICGNNENAKKEVGHIVELFGWEVSDMGSVEAARAIEPLCILWCIPGLKDNSWTHAFKLLKL